MIHRRLKLALSGLLAVSLLLVFSPMAEAFTLIEPNKPLPVIYISDHADPNVRDAATELARVLAVMTGSKPAITEVHAKADLSAVASGASAVPSIVLGQAAQWLGVTMNAQSRAGDGFRYKRIGHSLAIVGESGSGVYTGAVRWLESLGCGWYVPGPVGEVIPSKTTVNVPDDLDHTETSDAINRRFWYGGGGGGTTSQPWLRRNNGNNPVTGSWRHAYSSLVPKSTLKLHPEYGSLVNGKRTTKQLCTTNPQVIQIAAQSLIEQMKKSGDLVFPAGPNDGGGLCEGPVCSALDTPGYLEPTSNKPVTSDRIFTFASELADITSKTFPDRDLGILVYSEYSRIPKKIKLLNPNVFPMIAPIRRCRLHGPGTPGCESSQLFLDEIKGWAKVSPTKLGFYIYNYNLADALLPFSKIDYYKRLLNVVHELNIPQLAWSFESMDSWANHAPTLYLSVRLSWNSHLDVDQTMDHFYRGFYGSAYEPMKRYWSRIDHAIATADTHTGSSYGQHKIWTPELLKLSRQDIELAKKAAANDREKQAVAMAEAGLVSAEDFMRIWHALEQRDFPQAQQASEALHQHTEAMDQGQVPKWGFKRYTWNYYHRFIGLTVESGAKLVAQGGKIIVKMPETWQFKTDEKLQGVDQGWFKPDYDASHWKPMGTMDTSWIDSGLIWYHGDAWYRTTFTLPADAASAIAQKKDFRLWFGGYDNNVDTYLNGHSLGNKTGFAKPAEYDGITPLLNAKGPNVLTVRVSSGSLAELGTGGLMMPVMIYIAPPGAPAIDAKKPAKQKGKQGNDKKKQKDGKYKM